MKNKTIAILQARMSSNRLPGKVMMEINGLPMIYWQIQRVKRVKNLSKLIVATSTDQSDNELSDFLTRNSVDVFRGSLQDVLSRYQISSKNYEHHALVRLTGDCPLVMPELIDEMITEFYQTEVDYLSNTLDRTFPHGLDVEIVRSGVLDKLNRFILTNEEKEHVTLGVYLRPETFNLANFMGHTNNSIERWTVDYKEDFELINRIFMEFKGREAEFNYQDVVNFLLHNPQLRSLNSVHIKGEFPRIKRNPI